MSKNKRSNEQIQKDRALLREIIKKDFSKKEFRLREVYYHLNSNYNKSKIAMMYQDFRALVIDGFLSYRIIELDITNLKIRKKKGAIYKLSKMNLE